MTQTDSISTGDNLASLGGFALEILVVAAAMLARPAEKFGRAEHGSATLVGEDMPR